MKLFGDNVDGIVRKLEVLENLLVSEHPLVLFFQETKTIRAGRIKTPSSTKYTWYELNRTINSEKGSQGGGLAIGVLNVLNPSWISEGDDDAEVLTVEIWVEGFPIRLICCYGPQEYDGKFRKDKFWEYLNSEVANVKTDGASIILQMDGNLWAGNKIIPSDPKPQNQNGKRIKEFLLKNPNLTVVNATNLCEGKFTRVRNESKTIIDFFVVCDQLFPLVSKMKVDEKGKYQMSRYKGKVVRTDHNMLYLELNLTLNMNEKHESINVFNVRNKKCQKQFYIFTSKDDRFTKCLEMI